MDEIALMRWVDGAKSLWRNDIPHGEVTGIGFLLPDSIATARDCELAETALQRHYGPAFKVSVGRHTRSQAEWDVFVKS